MKNLCPILLVVLPLVSSQLVWERLHQGNESLAPAPRQDSSLGYDAARNRLILFGGKALVNGATVILSDTWSFDLNTGQWTEITTTPVPPPRFSMVFGVSGDSFYVSTGESRDRVFLNDIWKLNLQTDTWEKLCVEQKPPYYTDQQWEMQMRSSVEPDYRYGSAGGIFPGTSSFFISLGFANRRYFDTFRYDTTNMYWTQEYDGVHPYNPSYPHGRCLHGGTMVSESELVIYGGCQTGGGTGGPCPSGDSWMYNSRDRSWEQLPSCASPRMYTSMAMLPMKQGLRRAVLYGGIEKSVQVISTVESPADQVAVLNADMKEWALKTTTGTVPVKRSHAVMATGSDGIYMFGGNAIDGGAVLNDLYLLRGDAMTADQAPKAADCKPTFVNFILLHGVFMVLSWGVFLQWGAFVARYFRHKDPTWFKLHRFFQAFGLVISVVGVAFAFVSSKGHLRYAHSIIGVVVTLFGILQPINAALRPHKPNLGEVKSIRRLVWEVIHKNLGRLTLVLAIVQISLGVFLAVAHTGVWATWFAYVIFLLIAYIVAEINMRCKDMSSYETKGNVNPTANKSSANGSKQKVSPWTANNRWKPTPIQQMFQDVNGNTQKNDLFVDGDDERFQ